MTYTPKSPYPKKHSSKSRGYSPGLGGGKGRIAFSERRTTIESEDGTTYYVFHTRTAGYVHGDLVEYVITRPSKDGKLAEVRPTRLVSRSREELLMEVRVARGKIVYQIMASLGGGLVRLAVAPEDPKNGDLYIVRYRDTHIVEIVRYFGSESDPSIMEDVILFRSGVRREWPESLRDIEVADAPSLPDMTDAPMQRALDLEREIPDTEKLSGESIFTKIDIHGQIRYDLRSWPTMTIDGADAQDLDDAISIARYEGGDYLLAVHIADVSEYVTEGSPLDQEAYMRGTSIYTPGRVIPMLPEILSDDRCSLHPGSPKLTLSILMRVDPSGGVRESYVTESVIESREKGVYDEVYRALSSMIAPDGKEKTNQVPRHLEYLYSLYQILAKRREKEGKILFDMTECYFDLDQERHVENIHKRERNDAHMMIEEFMVLANEEVAKWCSMKRIPFLSRVHEAPTEEKEGDIREILDTTGHPIVSPVLEPRHIRSALEYAEKTGVLYRLSRLILPKMSKAVYSASIDRHFGLALHYYAHFTSPIRRYPDLLLHRMIKKYLHGTLTREKSIYEKDMKKWGKSLSEKERKAEEVSRAIDSLYMCRYMSKYVGQRYTGRISGLTESNIYIELESGVEGSIYLKDTSKDRSSKEARVPLIVDPVLGALKDRAGKIVYQIGDSLMVEIREIDLQTRRIEMSEINELK